MEFITDDIGKTNKATQLNNYDIGTMLAINFDIDFEKNMMWQNYFL